MLLNRYRYLYISSAAHVCHIMPIAYETSQINTISPKCIPIRHVCPLPEI